MNSPRSQWTVGELAHLVGAVVEGDAGRSIDSIADVSTAGPSQIAFFVDSRQVSKTAGAVICATAVSLPAGIIAVIHPEPRGAFARIAAVFRPRSPVAEIHPSAVVSPLANVAGATIGPFAVVGDHTQIGADTVVSAFAYIGTNVRIGEQGWVGPHATILDRVRIGDRVHIGPGAVIGGDGFGMAWFDGEWWPMPSEGSVEIADDVMMGANSCIDRGSFGDTRVQKGSKFDNLVQIAHNAQIGPQVVGAAFVGIAGGAEIGARVRFGGRSAVVDGVKVGDGATLLATASATRAVPPGQVIGGSPGRPREQWLRELAVLRQLPEWWSKQGGQVLEPIVSEQPVILDGAAIERLIPHRAPMRFLDRVIRLEPGQSAVGFHDVPAEPFWAVGHFPGQPILPGVLIAEALAQLAAVTMLSTSEELAGRPVYLTGFDKLRLRRPVRPGDSLKLEIRLSEQRLFLYCFEVKASVDGQKVADGVLLAAAERKE